MQGREHNCNPSRDLEPSAIDTSPGLEMQGGDSSKPQQAVLYLCVYLRLRTLGSHHISLAFLSKHSV